MSAPNPELRVARREVPRLLREVNHYMFNDDELPRLKAEYERVERRYHDFLDEPSFDLIKSQLIEIKRKLNFQDNINAGPQPPPPQEAGGRYIQPINHKPSEKYCCGAGTPPNILYKPF